MSSPAGPARRPVDVSIRYERFPATLKGAVVLRGGDGDPHMVRMESLEVARVPGGGSKPVAVGDVRVDVAPARDLFVPLEVTISDLEPGWYVVRSRIEVDVGRRLVDDSRPFAVPWPRGVNRTGTVEVGRTVGAGPDAVSIARVEMRPDRATVVWTVDRDEGDPAPTVELLVDGAPAEPVPAPAGLEKGAERRTVFYPVPRGSGRISVAARVRGDRSEIVELTAP